MAAGRYTVRGMIAGVALIVCGVCAWAVTGCEPGSGSVQPSGSGKGTTSEPKKETVSIGGRTFRLELAVDDKTRFKGLSGREEIAPDGGMLFAFPRPMQRLFFVMRDCPVPIDIIFLDGTGRIVAMHAMQPEPPRTDEEKVLSPSRPGQPEWAWVNADYENRLKRYPSRHDAQFVIEIKGGLLEELKLEEGQRINIDTRRLARLAREAEERDRKALTGGS